jgi:hypothetical protein
MEEAMRISRFVASLGLVLGVGFAAACSGETVGPGGDAGGGSNDTTGGSGGTSQTDGPDGAPIGGSDSGTGVNSTLCADACNVEVPDVCTSLPDELAVPEECLSGCEQYSLEIPPECASVWSAALACLRDLRAHCLPESACSDAFEAVEDCAVGVDPCLGSSSGTGWSGGNVSVSSIDVCGCEPEGAAEGVACAGSDDCAEVCCACPNGTEEYGVRACINGLCASPAQTCEEAIGTLC